MRGFCDPAGNVRTAAALLAVAVVLSACSGGSLGLPSWFTRSSGDPSAQASASVTGASPTAASAAAKPLEDDCPTVDIRTGAGTLAVAAKSADARATDLRYQLTFTELARQCTLDGGTVRMRVGVQGRAVVGPAGAPPQVNAPLRYAVVREGVQPKTIVTKFRRVPVALPPGTAHAEFIDIEEDLSFPMPSLPELQAYVVYVGFDELGDRQERPAKKKKRPPPR